MQYLVNEEISVENEYVRDSSGGYFNRESDASFNFDKGKNKYAKHVTQA